MLTGAVNRSKRELSREARAATITREQDVGGEKPDQSPSYLRKAQGEDK